MVRLSLLWSLSVQVHQAKVSSFIQLRFIALQGKSEAQPHQGLRVLKGHRICNLSSMPNHLVATNLHPKEPESMPAVSRVSLLLVLILASLLS